jgi:thiamine monophosphate synthase
MRIEDALLFVLLPREWPAVRVLGACSAAVACGADAVILRVEHTAPDVAREIGDLCGREGALWFVRGAARAAAGCGADGILVETGDGGLPAARLSLAPAALVGMAAPGPDEARLALSLGADFLVLEGAWAAAGAQALGRNAGVPLVAGGVRSREQARAALEGGAGRVCCEAVAGDDEALRVEVAEYAALLGRTL